MREFSLSPTPLGHLIRPCLNKVFVATLAITLVGGGVLQARERGSQGDSDYNLVTVTLTPSSATVGTGGTVGFTASASHASANENISWSVDGVWQGDSRTGTIPGLYQTVTYYAPLTPGTHIVTATSDFNNTKSASATVTVTGKGTQAPVAVTITPSSATLRAGTSTALAASVTGSSNTAVTWAVDGVAGGNATVGTITGSGDSVTYTAPAAAGSHTVTATSAATTSASASAVVTVQAAATVAVALSPATVSLNTGATTTLTATVTGSSNTAVTWTVDGVAGGNASVGTITGTGDSVTYTAPATAGSHTVTATSAASAASSASTAVTVQAASGSAKVALAYPGSSTVNVSGSMLFTATVTGTTTAGVNWTVDGVANGNATVGTITTGTGNDTVLYKAPAATGSHTVSAVSAAGGTAASVAVTVAATAYTVTNPTSNYNVKTYGATGNGSSDDTAAIQNAINAASAAGGGLVEVPAGTYMINCAYQSGEVGLLMQSNVTLQLDSGAMLKTKAGAPGTSYMVMFNGGSNMNLVGPGVLDGNKSAVGLGDNENIGFWGGSNIVLAGFTSQNAGQDGIYIDGYDSGPVEGPVTNVLIYGVTCTANGRNGMSPEGANGLIVRDCTFSNQSSSNPGNGIDCEPINNQKPNNYSIFNCTFTGNTGGGLQSGPDDSGDNATFTNMTYAFNTVTNCGNYGIEAQDGTGPVQILNNNVSGIYTATGVMAEWPGYGIMLRGSNGISNVTISGNTVSGCTSDGIFLNSASASTCSYNTVTGNGGEGIYNQSGSGVTVADNTESGNTGGN